MANILALTKERDLHFLPVAAALRFLGHTVARFGLGRYPWEDHQSIEIEGGRMTFASSALPVDFADTVWDVVWFRREDRANYRKERVDALERKFVGLTHSAYYDWLFGFISDEFPGTRSALWVNRMNEAMRAENKLLQLRRAGAVGLSTPSTLVTNDPDALNAFVIRHGAECICKTLHMAEMWLDDSGKLFGSFTAPLGSIEGIGRESIEVIPAIYQARVAKDYEVRTVFMGKRHLSIRIDSQTHESSKVDWRINASVAMSAYTLPEDIAQKCRRLMTELGISFACFDFIRTATGEYVFVELNQAGQFLFMEGRVPELPLLDAFCHFLAHGDLDSWNENRITFRYADVCAWTEVCEETKAILEVEKLEAIRENRVATFT